MKISNATAIRRAVREVGYEKTNREIAEEVKNRYGLDVGANQIIEILDPERDRQVAEAFQLRMGLLSDYTAQVSALSGGSKKAFCVSRFLGFQFEDEDLRRRQRPICGAKLKSWTCPYKATADGSGSGSGHGPAREVRAGTRKILLNKGVASPEWAPRRKNLLATEMGFSQYGEVRVGWVTGRQGGLSGEGALNWLGRSNLPSRIADSTCRPSNDGEKAIKLEKREDGPASSTTKARAHQIVADGRHTEGQHHA